MFYQNTTFSPRSILAKIFKFQCVFYLSLASYMVILDTFSGHSLSFRQIFSYASTNPHSGYGWINIISTLLGSLTCAIGLRVIVERSKKCLDHAVTAWIIHLCVCWKFDGFPRTWSWWIVCIISSILTAVLGEYLCMRREMMEIPLSRSMGSSTINTQSNATHIKSESESDQLNSGEENRKSSIDGISPSSSPSFYLTPPRLKSSDDYPFETSMPLVSGSSSSQNRGLTL